MEEIVNKKILKPYIDALLRRCSFLYGIKYIDELKRRLSTIDKVIVSDELNENVVMNYSPSKKCITMNKKSITRDKNNNYIFDFHDSSDFFKNSLFHELLHAASNSTHSLGIIPKENKSFNNSLNEGITQMITDDICGYYENKFLGVYNLEKIIAVILKESLSKDIVLDSYFLDSKILEDKVNEVSQSNYYYKMLNILLAAYNRKDNLRNYRLENILKSVTLNIIIPTYYGLDESKRENYLTRLLCSISGDEVIKNKIKDYINIYIKYSKKQIDKENTLIGNKSLEYEDAGKIMENIEDNLSKLLIEDDGTITILNDKRDKITSREDKEKIYIKLFELNGYDKYLTDDIINQYIDSIKKGESLIINNDSILKRRILFCGIKNILFSKGYYILNDFEELDKTNKIKINYINKSVTFEDYKKICENFSICKNINGEHKYSYSIIYNSTKNEVENETIKKIAFFANNWLLNVQDNGRDGIEEAFNEKNKTLFQRILNRLYIIYKKSNYFDYTLIEKLFEDKELIKKLLKTPIQVEWVHDYINYICKEALCKETKGISYLESKFNNYILERSNIEAREIIRN